MSAVDAIQELARSRSQEPGTPADRPGVQRSPVWTAVVVVVLAVYLADAARPLAGDGLHTFLGDWLKLIVYYGAVVVLIRAARAPGADPVDARSWRLLAVGLAAYALASGLAVVTESEGADVPTASLLLWLVFYALAYVAIFGLVRRHTRALAKSAWLDGLTAALALGAIAAATLWKGLATEAGTLQVVAGLAYPLADVLIIGTILLAISLTGFRPGRRWWLLLAAFGLHFAGDSIIVVRAAQDLPVSGTIYNACFPIVMVLLAAAARQPAAPVEGLAGGKRTIVLPVLAVIASFVILLLAEVSDLPSGSAVLALAALGVATLRAAWGFLEIRQVYESRRFEQGFDQAAIGMALLTPDGRWSRVNARLAEMLDLPADELQGHPVAEVVSGKDGGVVQFRRADGGLLEAEVTRADVEEADGRRWVFCQVVDVTERRRSARLGQAVTDLGHLALETRDVTQVLEAAVVAVREALDADACMVMRSRHGEPLAADPAPFPLAQPGVETVGIRHGAGGHALAVIGGVSGDEPTRFLQAVANVLATALDHAGTEVELRRRALEDPLTGLANRAMLTAQLERELTRSRRTDSHVAVVLLDLDRFKLVNDTLGHGAGDAVLRVVAERLAREVRGEDLVGRLGGDEFVVVSTHADPGHATALAERLVPALARPVRLDGRELPLGASIGVAVTRAGRASAEELLRDADVAMYGAKEGGGGRYELFDGRLRRRLLERVALEDALARAVEGDQLELRFQPIVDLDSAEVRGFEALLRWEHPERGLLGPASFVGVAEETGQIADLGRWALRTACAAAAAWPDNREGDRPWVAVNLSPAQVTQDLVADVRAALDDAGLEPARLRLEVTESLALDAMAVRGVLVELRRLGVRLALDDFGTGWSSLGSLQALPFDVLKLDRSFVARLGEPSSAAVLRAAVELGTSLELSVVAEGVENEGQRAQLRALGCPLGQGWLFSAAVPGEDVPALLAAQPAVESATATA